MDNLIFEPNDLNQEKEALEFIFKRIKAEEPSAVVSMPGMGKGRLLKLLLRNSSFFENQYQLISKICTDKQDLEELLNILKDVQEPTLCVIEFSMDEDVSWFVKELDRIRIKNSKFISVILSNLKNVQDATEKKINILVKSLYVKKPIDHEDCAKVIKNLEEKFDTSIEENIKKQICELSGGNIGVIKSLFMESVANPKDYMRLEEVINDDGIIGRLEKIMSDIPEEEKKLLQKNDIKSPFLAKYGLIKDGKIFSPLLEKYIKNTSHVEDDITLKLTPIEIRIFETLKIKPETVIDRDSIAKIIWNEEWTDKYSDWAIDQTIYRLRTKLSKLNSKYKIVTKKGMGFILTKED